MFLIVIILGSWVLSRNSIDGGSVMCGWRYYDQFWRMDWRCVLTIEERVGVKTVALAGLLWPLGFSQSHRGRGSDKITRYNLCITKREIWILLVARYLTIRKLIV